MTKNPNPRRLLARYDAADRRERFALFAAHARLREAFLGVEAEGIAQAMRAARLRRQTSTEG